ncbi:UPF0175 family protein [Candidatus Poribacteria bacterium]|nr:UPF0175 family protein [Candidatus Poribacteria bacterium]
MAEKKITEASVLTLVGEHKITASKGAQLLGMSVWDFHDWMHQHGVTLWDDTPEELEEDLEDLRRIRKKYEKKTKAGRRL